jgi:hypothetical protein
MRRFHATWRGLSLVELVISMAAASVVMLIGMTMWVLGWSQFEGVQHASLAYQDAFGVMNSIQEQVQRCNTIQVPDPDHAANNSIQLLVPNGAGTNLRRAYRRVGNNLIMEWKDEGIGPVTTFSDVTAFTASIQDAPTNSLVQLNCTCVDGSETISMTTVGQRRN